MQDFKPVDEVVDLPHEPFHEDHLRQADDHCAQLGGECLGKGGSEGIRKIQE